MHLDTRNKTGTPRTRAKTGTHRPPLPVRPPVGHAATVSESSVGVWLAGLPIWLFASILCAPNGDAQQIYVAVLGNAYYTKNSLSQHFLYACTLLLCLSPACVHIPTPCLFRVRALSRKNTHRAPNYCWDNFSKVPSIDMIYSTFSGEL